MTIADAIHRAEAILPGVPSPEGKEDARWQAIIEVAEFIEDEPEQVWLFAERWGKVADDDLQAAIATCVLEHLLQYHFDLIFPRVTLHARSSREFSRTFKLCSKFGQSEQPDNAAKFDRLQAELLDIE